MRSAGHVFETPELVTCVLVSGYRGLLSAVAEDIYMKRVVILKLVTDNGFEQQLSFFVGLPHLATYIFLFFP